MKGGVVLGLEPKRISGTAIIAPAFGSKKAQVSAQDSSRPQQKHYNTH